MIFNVNIPVPAYSYSTQIGALLFFELKEAMVAAGWKVKGSGDGTSLFALEGVTSELPVGVRGSGGAYDCWSNFSLTYGTPGSSYAARAWVLLEEPGGIRQHLFQQGAGTGGGGNQGNFIWAYDRAGALTTPSPDPVTAPTSASVRFMFGNAANGTGEHIFVASSNPTDLYRLHVWADGSPKSGVYAFGALATRSTNAYASMLLCTPLGPPDNVAADGDPLVLVKNFTTRRRWDMYGTPSENWLTTISSPSDPFWGGNGPAADERDGFDRISKLPIFHGSVATEKFAGAAEYLRWSGSPRSYPDFCRDQYGDCWVWGMSGYLVPWPAAVPPLLPPTPE